MIGVNLGAGIFLAALLLMSTSSQASEIILKNGHRVDGAIVERTDDNVKVDTGGSYSVYSTSDISRIDGVPVLGPKSSGTALAPDLLTQIVYVYSLAAAHYDSKKAWLIGKGKVIADNRSLFYWGPTKLTTLDINVTAKLVSGNADSYCLETAMRSGVIPEGQMLRIIGEGMFTRGGVVKIENLSGCEYLTKDKIDDEANKPN